MNRFKKLLLARLREPSTWYGMINVAAAFGVLNLTDVQSSAVSLALSSMLGVGAAAIITPDKQGDL